ncbi:MAG TPA: hypothetical protein VNI01_03635 [Elusimicrobiota bacterium]|jgi:hypothetical protein|nr:hypothetical protein [Elusimicrobiota bacterium]
MIPTLREEALAAMAADNGARYVGVTGDLFAFSDLRAWAPVSANADGSLPFLEINGAKPLVRVASLDEYRRAAAAVWAWLPEHLSGRMVVAGGCVARLVGGQALGASDIDLFPVGLDESGVRETVRALGDFLFARCGAGETLHAYRTRHCVSFVVAAAGRTGPGEDGERRARITTRGPDPGRRESSVRVVIQVILRLYSTVSEVLHGFDLGSCAVADDGKRLYFTSASRLAFERGLNVLDLSRRRASYEVRAAKYLCRGFALALPDLAPSAPYSLPFLRLEFPDYDAKTARVLSRKVSAKGPRVRMWGFELREKGGWGVGMDDLQRRSWPAPDAQALQLTSYELIRYDGAPPGIPDLLHNLRMVRTGRKGGVRAHALYAPGMDAFSLQPCPLDRVLSDLESAPTDARQGLIETLAQLLWSDGSGLVPQAMAELDWKQSVCVIKALVAKRAPELALPSGCETASDESIALSTLDARISPQEWYGSHFRPARPPAVRAETAQDRIRSILALLFSTDVVAHVIVPYLGPALDAMCGSCGGLGVFDLTLYGAGIPQLVIVSSRIARPEAPRAPDVPEYWCGHCATGLFPCRDPVLGEELTFLAEPIGYDRPRTGSRSRSRSGSLPDEKEGHQAGHPPVAPGGPPGLGIAGSASVIYADDPLGAPSGEPAGPGIAAGSANNVRAGDPPEQTEGYDSEEEREIALLRRLADL